MIGDMPQSLPIYAPQSLMHDIAVPLAWYLWYEELGRTERVDALPIREPSPPALNRAHRRAARTKG